MRRAPKGPTIVWRQRCPACGSILPTNGKVPYAEPGGADLLEQEFAGRGRIVNVRTLSYLGDGPYEKAFRLRWVERLGLILRILTGRVMASSVVSKNYSAPGIGRVEELPRASTPNYGLSQLTIHQYGGGSP